MENKIKLDLIGITYNQIESGVYAVVLQESGGRLRLPIIIGTAEAQSIECKLQNVITPRPLTHDLMASMIRAFSLELQEVNLYRLPTGIFAADLVMTNGMQEVRIDSRSSDAIALAIRCNAPIYTNRETLDEAGFDPEASRKEASQPEKSEEKADDGLEALRKLGNVRLLEEMSVPELEEAMADAVAAERYEEAAEIKAELDKRKEE